MGMKQYYELLSLPFVWVGNPNSFLINGKDIPHDTWTSPMQQITMILPLSKWKAWLSIVDPDIVYSVDTTNGK
jgi:hypothetical protein